MVMWSLWARKRPFDKGDIARVFLRTMQGHDVRPPLPGERHAGCACSLFGLQTVRRKPFAAAYY